MKSKIQQIYTYTESSQYKNESGLSLAVSLSEQNATTPFFIGSVLSPEILAPLLLANTKIAMSRFYTPPNMIQRLIREADPVITVAPMGLRFESFSQCCGVYSSTFIDSEKLHINSTRPGTTNVDFNAPMRSALAKLRSKDELSLQIGKKGIQVDTQNASVIERKVHLPIRWIKGFMESQSYLSNLDQTLSLEGPKLRQFLNTIPNVTHTRDFCYLVQTSTGIRQTQLKDEQSIAVAGIGRIHILKKLARKAKKLMIYGNRDSQVSAFELHFDGIRFQILLSPNVSRGFSGEGQLLLELSKIGNSSLAELKANLNWSTRINEVDIAEKYKLDASTARSLLIHLAHEGRLGYDKYEKYWFKRSLPFLSDDIAHLQPRLKGAQNLLNSKKINYLDRSNKSLKALLGDVPHTVDMYENELRCSCEWYTKYKDNRGPCKHILAIHLDQQLNLDAKE